MAQTHCNSISGFFKDYQPCDLKRQKPPGSWSTTLAWGTEECVFLLKVHIFWWSEGTSNGKPHFWWSSRGIKREPTIWWSKSVQVLKGSPDGRATGRARPRFAKFHSAMCDFVAHCQGPRAKPIRSRRPEEVVSPGLRLSWIFRL